MRCIMAFLQISLMSEALLRTVNVNAIIPVDKVQLPDQAAPPTIQRGNFKTLYLLHGIFGSQVDWINGTMLQRWAEEKNIAVIMPAGENRFYVDQPQTHDFYGRFIGEELVQVTRALFPLSKKKEDTFIGGLSMGAYGAMRNGLKYHETFGAIAALSMADVVSTSDYSLDFLPSAYLNAVFGDLQAARESDNSIHHLIRTNATHRWNDQKIYLACGENDCLFGCSERARDLLKANHYDVTFEQGPGGHDWDFWNTYLHHILEWLPI